MAERVNPTKVVSRFFDSAAHSLPITFYNRFTPDSSGGSPTESTPYYPNEYPKVDGTNVVKLTGTTLSWKSVVTDKYKFDSALTKTRVKSVWSSDISNWHYPKVFHPGFEYAIWGISEVDESGDGDYDWSLIYKVADIPNSNMTYVSSSLSNFSTIIVMIHNSNYPPTTNILTATPKPDCWHFLVGEAV